jgi:4-oxalocrotonate tautomerase
MPFITVQLTREGTEPGVAELTPDQKAAIFKGMTQIMSDVLGKPPEWTWVVIRQVEPEDWGWGGLPVTDYRRQLAATPR